MFFVLGLEARSCLRGFKQKSCFEITDVDLITLSRDKGGRNLGVCEAKTATEQRMNREMGATGILPPSKLVGCFFTVRRMSRTRHVSWKSSSLIS